MLVMLLTSPVSHMHYQALCVPVVMGILACHLPRGTSSLVGALMGSVFIACNSLPHIPAINFLRDFGLAMYATLALWVLAVVSLARTSPTPVNETIDVPARRAA